MQNIFIIGSKGIPAAYGGYETFVDKLTERQVSHDIKYHVACAVDNADETKDFEYNNAYCFSVLRRPVGAAKAVFYDIDALKWCISFIKKNKIKHPIVYILACRIGPFIGKYVKQLHELGGVVFVNPDGHEWKRAKWNMLVRRYWKTSEYGMVKHSDLLVCDSVNIEEYIKSEYAKLRPQTTYIAYGADVRRSKLEDKSDKWIEWLNKNNVRPYDYYLVVGRFVPENNYEIMLKEFMASSSRHDFVLVTNVNSEFLRELEYKTHFRSDPRIKFVGTVYDQELLKKVRENAFAYLHGHEVGGTNPSLLEALSSTKLNLLLDVGFNREVAEGSALYWNKKENSLSSLIEKVEQMSEEEIELYNSSSLAVVKSRFSWEFIVGQYEKLFLTYVKSNNKEFIID